MIERRDILDIFHTTSTLTITHGKKSLRSDKIFSNVQFSIQR